MLDTRAYRWTRVDAGDAPNPASPYANMCSPMVVCILFSRFALVAALEGRRELMGEAVSPAPEGGGRGGGAGGGPPGGGGGGGRGGGPGGGGAPLPRRRAGPPPP